MMVLNCIIVDDEPLARKQLTSYVERITSLKLVGTARNTATANEILKSTMVDLVFLDIKMPGVNGIDFLKTEDVFQQVIIVSAFPQYALEGFELEVTDYLMKPVSFERFAKACDRALAKTNGTTVVRAITQQTTFLYVKCNQRFEKILIDEILYIESMLNYVSIITKNRRLMIYSSLKAMETNLPKDIFVKIHKSYLVAVAHLQTIEGHQVKIGEMTLPVSRTNKQAILQLAQRLKLKPRDQIS